jgi:hypothetical protein
METLTLDHPVWFLPTAGERLRKGLELGFIGRGNYYNSGENCACAMGFIEPELALSESAVPIRPLELENLITWMNDGVSDTGQAEFITALSYLIDGAELGGETWNDLQQKLSSAVAAKTEEIFKANNLIYGECWTSVTENHSPAGALRLAKQELRLCLGGVDADFYCDSLIFAVLDAWALALLPAVVDGLKSSEQPLFVSDT